MTQNENSNNKIPITISNNNLEVEQKNNVIGQPSIVTSPITITNFNPAQIGEILNDIKKLIGKGENINKYKKKLIGKLNILREFKNYLKITNQNQKNNYKNLDEIIEKIDKLNKK